MTALCTGSYGLSQNCSDNSKQYFFVKVTDSAYRAIEDYERNLEKYKTTATIQFLENGGIISFPTASENAGQQFTFAIENEGSLECIQQKQSQLDVLGTLQYKMRIHANEDVYETTRHRMAVAEETQKKKSTVEIKPNQTDIGRKVKLKNSNNRLQNIPLKRDHVLTNTTSFSVASSNVMTNGIASTLSSSLSPSRDSINNHQGGLSSATTGNNTGSNTSSSIISNLSSSGYSNQHIKTGHQSSNNSLPNSSLSYIQNYNPVNSNGNSTIPTAASSLSSAFSSAAGSGTSGIISGYTNSTSNSNSRVTCSLNAGNSSLIGAGSRKNPITSAGNTNRNLKSNNRHNKLDITKRNIRERLIHMLALKNLKKPEILARLLNEGVREKDKNLISVILKEISTIRDNTFNLKRPIWNEVNENWPFYTEQDLQMLKRRKPQNLTPPLSSDGGSSTSGQSPTSTHNGSPPPAVKRPGMDRDRYYEEPAAKKQRISHFKKDVTEISCSNATLVRQQQDSEDSSCGLSYSVLGTEAARRFSPKDGAAVNGTNISVPHQLSNVNQHHYPVTKSNICSSGQKIINNTVAISGGAYATHSSPTSQNNHIGSNSNSSINNNNNNNTNNHNNNNNSSYNSSTNSSNISNSKGFVLGGDNQRQCHSPMNGPCFSTNGNSTSSPESSIKNSRASFSPCMAAINNVVNGGPFDRDSAINSERTDNKHILDMNRSKIDNLATEGENFDFSCFKKITAIEQRRKYKTEFGKDYDEYKKLLIEIDRVRTRFTVLAHELSKARNNDANYRSIKKQIVDEYQRIQTQREHQNVKARFNYLHAKLAYIKNLVSEYDKTLTSEHILSSAETPMSSPCSESTNESRNKNADSPSQNNFSSSGSNRPGYHSGSVAVNNNTAATTYYPGRSTTPISPNSQYSTPSNLTATNEHHLPKNENY